MSLEEKAKAFAIKCHEETNHKYDHTKPYSFHLQMVVAFAYKYKHLVPKENWDSIIAGCWTHDLIEDCRVTYNDVKKETSELVAEYAYALTNEKGRNREERANDKYYAGIKKLPFATFIKVCDRLANATYSKQQGSDMVKKYSKENAHFESRLYEKQYDEMFTELDTILNG